MSPDSAFVLPKTIEHHLATLSKLYGYRYEEPKLYEGSMRLIVTSPMKFIKHYAWLLKQMDKDPFSVSYIF